MANLILEKSNQVSYFTCMRSIFEALQVDPSEYDWYLSDIEVDFLPLGFNDSDQWMSGDDLRDFINLNEIQFIWGIFSAVPKGHRVVVDNALYADGNPDYWKGADIKPQLKDALFEICCRDSSATILVGISEEMATHLVSTYSDARPLSTTAS